jgi:hypothetical protein
MPNMEQRHTSQSSLLLPHNPKNPLLIKMAGLPLRHPAQGFNASQQLIKSDRGSMLTMSDDNVMMKQIVGTHAPDGREVDVKPLLLLVEDILKRATLQIDSSLTVYY